MEVVWSVYSTRQVMAPVEMPVISMQFPSVPYRTELHCFFKILKFGIVWILAVMIHDSNSWVVGIKNIHVPISQEKTIYTNWLVFKYIQIHNFYDIV